MINDELICVVVNVVGKIGDLILYGEMMVIKVCYEILKNKGLNV